MVWWRNIPAEWGLWRAAAAASSSGSSSTLAGVTQLDITVDAELSLPSLQCQRPNTRRRPFRCLFVCQAGAPKSNYLAVMKVSGLQLGKAAAARQKEQQKEQQKQQQQQDGSDSDDDMIAGSDEDSDEGEQACGWLGG